MTSRYRDRVLGAAIATWLGGRGLLARRPRRDLAQRLAMLPAEAPVSRPVTLRWNPHAIPFIAAEDDADLPVALGTVHAHLRLAQMEMMRRVAQGRLSEYAGPLGIEADRTLRLLDLGRAVPAIVAGLAPTTRVWAEGFVRGVNHVVMHGALPEEMRLLGIGREPWTLPDLFLNARLAGADVSWVILGRLLRARAGMSPAAWRQLWPRLLAAGAPNPQTSVEAALTRAGSNAAAVAGRRSANGAALLAADPHLSVTLPNIWLAVSMHAPGMNVAGLMPAGFPIVAIGRNRHIAWGGTSLHAAATDLFDVAGEALSEEHVMLRVRGAGRRRLTLRRSRSGPVVSDGEMFRSTEPLALRWVGHTPSDEMGAMLAVMRAEDGAAFERALADFAIPGQNMVYATAAGAVGHVLALAVPRRTAPPADVPQPPERLDGWDRLARTPDYVARHDPPTGFVASANDRPPSEMVPADAPPGYFYSPGLRASRLGALIGGATALTLDDMAATQCDVHVDPHIAHALAQRLPDPGMCAVLHAWNGAYDARSVGALLFEAWMAIFAERLPDRARQRGQDAIWAGRRLLAEDVLALDDETFQRITRAALPRVRRIMRRHTGWGSAHRMPLRHYFGALPVIGRRYRFGDYPSAGGNDTLNKTGHAAVDGRHRVTYGASARFLADMADPDANRVVLLGGQDGWLGSANFLDQVGLWRAGAYLDLPLRPQAAQAWPYAVVLRPA